MFKALGARIHRMKVAFRTDTFRALGVMKALGHINPMVGRGFLGRAVGRLTKSFFSWIHTGYMQRKVVSSEVGRELAINKATEFVMKVMGKKPTEEKDNIRKTISEGLKGLKGKAFVRKLQENVLRAVENDRNKAQKVLDALDEYFSRGVVIGKHNNDIAIYDLDSETVYYMGTDEEGKKQVNHKGIPISGGKDKFTEGLRELKKYGINLKKEYAELKENKLIIETLLEAENPKHARELFESKLKHELQNDPFFAESYARKQERELVRTYNIGAVVGALHETLTTVPSRLLALASRLVAQAYRMLPIVGAIASAQVEAAGAVAEIGEAISSKVESSAYMYYNLSSLGNVGAGINAFLMEQGRRMQQSVQEEAQKAGPQPA